MKNKTLYILFAAIFLCTACEEREEVAFDGTIVYIQECTLDPVRPTAGYAVQLHSPDSLGVNFTYDNRTYKNVVLLFDPGRILKVGNRIHGTFYFDQKASRQYCSLTNLHDLEIPQGVFVDVSVD